MLGIALGAAGATAAAGLAWSLFEAQWVELLEWDVSLPQLPDRLDGFRILHLSDFHLGTRSLNGRALGKALDWAADRELDLAAVTGDLVSRPGGETSLREALARLAPEHGTYAVLGNHDVAETRDPFSRPARLAALEDHGARLLEHASHSFAVDGLRVQVVGCDPRRDARPAEELADPGADLRILLAHFPEVAERVPPGAFHLILAGHLHGGQICLPTPRGKLRLQHLRKPRWEGLFDLPAGTLHVSRGLGTTLVPFRFLARPEATILTLRARQ